mmetsp:Transcript_25244/g.63986  ORF Transcript_25244/g.63986 Transcript_25244/m.63986 type:complete len:218 (-) Transcript_25244:209-862(-)
MAESAVRNSVLSCCCTRRISSLLCSIPSSRCRISRRCSQRLPSSWPTRSYSLRNLPPNSLPSPSIAGSSSPRPRPSRLNGQPPLILVSDCPSLLLNPSRLSLLLSCRSSSRSSTLCLSDDSEAAVSLATSASSPFISWSDSAALSVLVPVLASRLPELLEGTMLLVTAMICLRSDACPRRARIICVRHWARLKACSAASSEDHPAGSRGVYVDTGSC